MFDEHDDMADETTPGDTPETPPVEPTVEDADVPEADDQDPLRAAQARLLDAQRVFFATPHAQTNPDLVGSVEDAKDGVRAAMAQAGHQRA